MAEFKEETTAVKCGPCLFDGNTVEPKYFCVDCLEYLCTECIREHRRNKSLREHKILEENELPKDVTLFEEMKKLSQCQLHTGVELDQYCPNHDVLICPYCLQKDHVLCQNLIGLTCLLEKENTTDNPCELILELQTKCQSQRTELISISKTSQTNKREAEQQLHLFIKTLRTNIDYTEKTLNEKLDSLTSPLTQSIERADNAISNIEQKASLYENLLAVTSTCGTGKQNTVLRFMISALVKTFTADTSVELNEAEHFKFTHSFSPEDIDSMLRRCDISLQCKGSKASDLYSDEALDDGQFSIEAKTQDAATQVDTKAFVHPNTAKSTKSDLKNLKVSYAYISILKCKCPNTKDTRRSVIALEILTDGRILLLHEYTIKLYSATLTLVSKFQLANKINDMCIVSEKRDGSFILALCFEQLSKVKCLEHTGEFRENSDITCSQSIISICMHFHHLVVLLKSGGIQLIDIPTGHVCYSYEEFRSKRNGLLMALPNRKRICAYKTKRNQLILVDGTMIYILNISGGSCEKDTLYLVCSCEEYFSNWDEDVENSTIEDVKCDSQGNIYVVNEDGFYQLTVSKKVSTTRNLIPKIKSGSAFAIDEDHNRVVVGYTCQASAHVFVYNCPAEV